MKIEESWLQAPVRGLRIDARDGKVSAALATLQVRDLSAGDVLIRTAFAGVNYKDALATTTDGKVIRTFPRVGGVDMTGTVVACEHPAFAAGDLVLAHSRGIGVEHDGGFATFARLPGASLQHLPAGLSLQDAGAIGMAGFSAALCIELLEEQGVRPGGGPILVNGASGAVAGLAIDMLSALGYEVSALSSKPGSAARLRALGAREVLLASELADDGKPLSRARWQGAIDSVGGKQLDWLIRSAQPKGTIVCLGNASGNALATNVLPLILRGVRIVGANAMVYIDRQQAIWARMASDLKPSRLLAQVRYIGLDQLPDQLAAMLAGTADGRAVVRF